MFDHNSQDKKAEIEFFSNLVKGGKIAQVCPWNEDKFERVVGYLRRLDHKKADRIRVLDLGCGPGDFTRRLISIGFSTTGIDISQDLLQVNCDRNPQASLICGDAENLPFNDASFDIVVCTFVLHHFRRHEMILSEACRVLVTGGVFVSVEPNSWNPLTWYQHNSPFGKKKHEDSMNERIFGPLYLKHLLSQQFEIVEAKSINFDFMRILTPLEGVFERLFPINLFGGSLLVYGKKAKQNIGAR